LIEEIPDRDDIGSHSYTKNVDSVVTGIAIVHVITGMLTLPIIYVIFSSTTIQAPILYIFMVWIEVVILVATIPLYILLGIAIWRVQSWAWKVAVIANVIFLIFNIVGAVILPAILNIVLLLALSNQDVRSALKPIDQEG